MNPIDFGGQKSKLMVTMDFYCENLVNAMETELLCASSSNLADILIIMTGWTLLFFRSVVKSQGQNWQK